MKKDLNLNYPDISKGSQAIVLNLTIGKTQDDGASPWYTELDLGTPGQTMRIMIDTGTTHSWVTTTWCKNVEASPPLRRQFNPDESSSYNKITDDLAAISFGPWGTLYAKLEKDIVNLPLNNSTDKREVEFKFYFAKSYSGYKFEVLDYDGFFAIPPFPLDSADNKDSEQIVQRAYQDGIIESRLASFYYDQNNGTGECVIGAIDSSKFEIGSENIIPVKYALMYPNSWGAQLEDFLYNGESLIEIPYYTFILDTGSSLFKGDPELIEKIISKITDNQNLPETFTAEDYSKYITEYKDIEIVLNGKKYTFIPEQYFIFCEDRNLWRIAFEIMDGFDGILLVGSVFLNYYYTVFDIENKVMIIADKVKGEK